MLHHIKSIRPHHAGAVVRVCLIILGLFAGPLFAIHMYSVFWAKPFVFLGFELWTARHTLPATATFEEFFLMGVAIGKIGVVYGLIQAVQFLLRRTMSLAAILADIVTSFPAMAVMGATWWSYLFMGFSPDIYQGAGMDIWGVVVLLDVVNIAIALLLLLRAFGWVGGTQGPLG